MARSDIITAHTVRRTLPASQRRTPPAFLAITFLWPVAYLAQASPPNHMANPANPADLAVLRASGDQTARGVIRNSCDTAVHPTIAFPAPNVAVEIEEDTAGTCSGSNPPSTLTVLVKTGPTWRVSTATSGANFRLGPVHAGFPEIVVEYPPSQQDCPVLGWRGHTYEMIQPCAGARGQ